MVDVVLLQRHLELVSDSETTKSRSVKKSRLNELSTQLMSVQLRETSLTVQLNELKQETLQFETVVSQSNTPPNLALLLLLNTSPIFELLYCLFHKVV